MPLLLKPNPNPSQRCCFILSKRTTECDTDVHSSQRGSCVIRKWQMDYNKNKGGVDNLDKLTATYTFQRMTRWWPMVVFYNIFDVSAYICVVDPHSPRVKLHQNNKRRMFLEELESSFVKAHIEQRDPAAAALVRLLQSSPNSSQQHEEHQCQHPSQPALPQHQPQQPQPQPQWDRLILKEGGVRSTLAIMTERRTHCPSPAKIFLQRTH